MGRLKVKNWAKYQHYKDRNPPWIKLATNTFQDYEFSRLQDASKLLAVCIWTLAARSTDGYLPHDFEYIKNQCCLGNTVKPDNLKELITQGFIESDSDMLADCKRNACPETETETEGETEKTIVRSAHLSEEVYSLYPRKVAKSQAIKSINRALRAIQQTRICSLEEAATVLIQKVREFASSPAGNRGEYTPHCATWMNQGRWNDDPAEWQRTSEVTNGKSSASDWQPAKKLPRERYMEGL